MNKSTGESVRLAARSGTLTTPTSGLAATYVQANLIALPAEYAADFRLLCHRNPVPCPLLAESIAPGRWEALKSHIPGVTGKQVAQDLDLRRDFPRYMVYDAGNVVKAQCLDVETEWTNEHVGFLIGCSFSFEAALTEAGLKPAHMAHQRNVPMYKTNLPLCPAGVFRGATFVVSMRLYRAEDVDRVREVTRPYVATHGEPIDWGWVAVTRLGIRDVLIPEFGDAPVLADGSLLDLGYEADEDGVVPVFWGCGVTPQVAVSDAALDGTVLGHAPGHMIVLDIRDWDIIPEHF
jgi:uncharacterized protein YcsI (UPF0317 family)